MTDTRLGPEDLRLMQGLAQQITALRPEAQNNDATVGELAWIWGKDHADQGGTWRHRLCTPPPGRCTTTSGSAPSPANSRT